MEFFGLQGFHPVQPAFLVVGRPAKFLKHFRQARVEDLARVAFPYRMDPELVRLYEKIPVRYLFRDPEAAFACGRHLHLKDPGLVLVGNGQCLGGSPEAVFVDQAAHKMNGFAGGFAPFQRDAAQFG